MATLRDIKRRIRSVESTQKIPKSMKLVAAAKLRRAQERVIGARPYAQKMGELLGSLVGRVGDDGHPLLVRHTCARKRLGGVPAHKGLCGACSWRPPSRTRSTRFTSSTTSSARSPSST